MLLVVDVGNTETVFGLYQNADLCAHWRLSSKEQRTSDECWILLKMWFEAQSYRLEQVDGVVISSVVPHLTMVLCQMVRNRLKLNPMVVSSDSDVGMPILYDSPRTVGADRICNAVAGFHRYGGPLVVVDFGTATTFDIVTEQPAYLGGIIALGIQGVSQELHRLAAKLPRVGLDFPDAVIGKNTENSMKSGIMWGAVAMVDGLIRMIQSEMGWKEVMTVATGGIAGLVIERCRTIHEVEPYLTLEGMRLIYERQLRKS